MSWERERRLERWMRIVFTTLAVLWVTIGIAAWTWAISHDWSR